VVLAVFRGVTGGVHVCFCAGLSRVIALVTLSSSLMCVRAPVDPELCVPPCRFKRRRRDAEITPSFPCGPLYLAVACVLVAGALVISVSDLHCPGTALRFASSVHERCDNGHCISALCQTHVRDSLAGASAAPETRSQRLVSARKDIQHPGLTKDWAK